MNLVDLILITVLIAYAALGYLRGFIKIFSGLFFLIISIIGALFFHNQVAEVLGGYFSVPRVLVKALSFVLIIGILQVVFGVVEKIIFSKIPEKAKQSKVNHFFGFLLAFFKGIILLSIVLVSLIIIPFADKLKEPVMNSAIGNFLISKTSGIEGKVNNLLGDAIRETFTLLTIKPQSDEKVDLKFKTSNLKVDEVSEERMLELVNQERTSRGLKALKIDTTIREVARLHSKDMFEKGYFAHENQEGLSPFDRMLKGGVKFFVAGENLALAPNVLLAHQGLMDSPGHRENILKPDYGRIGIGVQDGGNYGRMFTQNFAD